MCKVFRWKLLFADHCTFCNKVGDVKFPWNIILRHLKNWKVRDFFEIIRTIKVAPMAAHCANHCLVGKFKIANFVQNVQHNRTSSKVLEKSVQSVQSTMQTHVENVPLQIVQCKSRLLASRWYKRGIGLCAEIALFYTYFVSFMFGFCWS